MKIFLLVASLIFLPFKDNEIPFEDITETKNNPKLTGDHREDAIEFIRTDVYEGTVNGTTKISFYIQEQEHPCGGNMTLLDAMYKYESQENWILLNITEDRGSKRYCMVENDFTGVLLLQENGTDITGNWISPNSKEQYQVVLKKVNVDENTMEAIGDTYEKLYYTINGGC